MPVVMSLAGLLPTLVTDPALAEVLRAARAGDRPVLELVSAGELRAVAIAALAADPPIGAGRTVLAVTATGREADQLVDALDCLLPAASTAAFPAWETLPHERLSPRSDTVGQRLSVLRRLSHPKDPGGAGPVRVVVAPVRSLLQPLVAGLGDLEPVGATAGDEIGMDVLVERLASAAYTRVDLVERRGEFAVRGGILDVFPPTDEHPLRLEFWGDTIEEIRWFAVADQRSLEIAEDGLWAPPCRELLLDSRVRARAAVLADEYPGLADVFSQLAEGIAIEGMESLAPVLVPRMELLTDVLPEGTSVVLCDPERIRTRAHDLVATGEEFLAASWAAAAAGGSVPLDLGSAAYRELSEVRSHALESGAAWWTLTPFAADPELATAHDGRIGSATDPDDGPDVLTLAGTAAPEYRGDVERALADLKEWLSAGWRLLLVTEGHGPAERIHERLREAGIPARLGLGEGEVDPRVVHVVNGALERGFVHADLGVAVLTETDLVGQRTGTRERTRLPSRRRHVVDPLQLRPGDYVVHDQHGVGRYVEMVQRTVAGATREYLVVEYAASKRGQPADRLYVPTDQLDQVTKYVGGEAPSVNRLGGSDWQKTKGRARKAVREIAAELIRLYSARTAAPGYAFGPDTPWQAELEDAFAYNETPDQLEAITEVKADMQRPVPMDRLICGDVGYGKTEIAVRAAFKAVQDGKQVAVLVPTTLLVQQHLATFSERYAQFPVVVRPLSRFQTDSEAAAVLAGLAGGSVDVVIGTHRLLTPDARFKDLGLVIVDEEQRFGVEHKEHLKRIRTAVDVLSLSATPIPRTLEMAVSGIREMSVIQTPPEERHPVLTFVGAYDEKQIAAAIRRELLRDGQVFYVHNRVESIDRVTARISELVPEARVATAHGQMNEHLLEQVILDFWERKFDVLVSTTIVESGLDIANANTLIVERADAFGLSQLHQLRGRVGRARERAYSYFLYAPEKPLSETAYDRLATIASHTDLGAGMQVALKDLEIRGAGNLLGGEQSGHIAGVGFDLYVRMVGEAVEEFKSGGAVEQPPEIRVELPVDAHLPHEYIPGERLRLEAYRRIAEALDADAVAAVREELVDRYGAIPAPVENLLAVASLRVKIRAAGLTEVTLAGTMVRFAPVELAESAALRVNRLYPRTVLKPATRTMLVPRPATARVGGQPLSGVGLLAWCAGVVDAVQGSP
jgi:transcription-repair coupling factor (superfamily II helicase)